MKRVVFLKKIYYLFLFISNMIKLLKMAFNYNKEETQSNKLFTEKETNFIMVKLREATYKGSEFETFYEVMSKLQQQKE